MSQVAMKRFEDSPADDALRQRLPPEFAALFGALERVVELLAADRAPQSTTPVWISIEKASELSGLSENLLRRLVKAKVIVGIPDGCTKVRKSDVDAFDPAKLPELPKARPGGHAYAKGKGKR